MGERIVPYGSWPSRIDAATIAAGTRRLDESRILGGRPHWSQGLPEERGRTTVMRRDADGGTTALVPAPHSVRSRVNEMGGGAFTGDGERLWFVDAASQQIHVREPDGSVSQLTDAPGRRFGDLTLDPVRPRLFAVEEDHRDEGEAVTRLVVVALDGGSISTVAEGSDFYSSPRPSPDGDQLAWLSWDHPQMPFDRTHLWLADLDGDGHLSGTAEVDFGAPAAICQPRWSPAGTLHAIADPDGWWHLYRMDGGRPVPLTQGEYEYGQPQWILGMSCYGFLSEDGILAARTRDGVWSLVHLDAGSGEITGVAQPLSHIDRVDAAEGLAVLQGGSPERPDGILERAGGSDWETLAISTGARPDDGYVSHPRTVSFPTGGGDTAHGLYYPPANPDVRGPAGAAPPLIVKCHGGPTGATDTSLNLKRLFWTSRGFGLLDVNYRGSTGYGRDYRERLYGAWGVADVEDCAAGVRLLVSEGLADPDKVFISGSSAGGFTVLRALLDTDVFCAGACYYGISDLEALQADTHKFESRYCDRLIAPWPEGRDRYRALSPIHQAGDLHRPVIFFQGDEDAVVPPDQTRRMYEDLEARGILTEYHLYRGEGHGFRGAEAIRSALDAESAFFQRLLGDS